MEASHIESQALHKTSSFAIVGRRLTLQFINIVQILAALFSGQAAKT